MARGLGGDDGPSLWMFVAVILVWGSIKSFFADARDKLEIGKNSAGPMQSETTAQIDRMTKQAEGIPVDWARLPQAKTYYQNIADAVYYAMEGVGTDEDKLFTLLKPLDPNELRAVARLFGVREQSYGLTTFSGGIFQWFDNELADGLISDYLTQMHTIWKPTRLW